MWRVITGTSMKPMSRSEGSGATCSGPSTSSARSSTCTSHLAGTPRHEGCIYPDRWSHQRVSSSRLARERGAMGFGVADNVHETGVSPLDILDCPSWSPRRSRSSELGERPGHGPDPRFLCPTVHRPARPALLPDAPVPDGRTVLLDPDASKHLRPIFGLKWHRALSYWLRTLSSGFTRRSSVGPESSGSSRPETR